MSEESHIFVQPFLAEHEVTLVKVDIGTQTKLVLALHPHEDQSKFRNSKVGGTYVITWREAEQT